MRRPLAQQVHPWRRTPVCGAAHAWVPTCKHATKPALGITPRLNPEGAVRKQDFDSTPGHLGEIFTRHQLLALHLLCACQTHAHTHPDSYVKKWQCETDANAAAFGIATPAHSSFLLTKHFQVCVPPRHCLECSYQLMRQDYTMTRGN